MNDNHKNTGKNSQTSYIADITKFLIDNENVCLVIQGAWGIGKTYLWKEVEKEIEKGNKEKRVVYIDLFGKESYRQILEEIVLRINEIRDERVKKVHNKIKPLLQFLKSVKLGYMGISVGMDSIFSIFKKEDFKNIIVCFDNIERKSAKLPLDEILGLVNLLKEDKQCNVVMILNKEELEKQQESQQDKKELNHENDKIVKLEKWYKVYKEKVIDYEIPIENNDEMARKIIEDNLEWDTKVKQEIVNLIFEYFKEEFNNNLRLLIKFTKHINYFNKHCFFKCYEEDKHKEFFDALELYYRVMVVEIKQYYSLLVKNEKKFKGQFPHYKEFLNNLLKLKDEEELQGYFLEAIRDKARRLFDKKQQDYYYGNLSDKEYAAVIKNMLQNTTKYIVVNGIHDGYNYYVTLFEQYERITKEELRLEKEGITKQFIEALVEKESGVDIDDDFLNMGFDTIRDLIQKEEKYKQFYEERKSEKYNITDIESLKNLSKDEIHGTFSPRNVVKYNNFSEDEIVKVFQDNNEFCKVFAKYFSNHFSDSISGYDFKNHLFQAYKKFLNQEKYKVKKEIIKENLKSKNNNSPILKLLDEDNGF